LRAVEERFAVIENVVLLILAGLLLVYLVYALLRPEKF
jgi:K+-transporting ATPase KdpF subunit